MTERKTPSDTDSLVEQMKDDLRIDAESDAAYLGQLVEQAEDVIMHSVDSTIETAQYYERPMFVRAVSLLAGSWFFNRLAVTQVPMAVLPYGVEMIINSLRGMMWGGDDSGADSGSIGTE
jgi:uncharacterized phage protein (predicted DNA packaging)